MLRIKLLPIIMLTFLIAACNSTKDNEELFGATVASQLVASKMEADLITLINDYRTSEGLNNLQLSDAAYRYAHQHTIYMIDLGEINHDNFSKRAANLATETNAELISENVAKDYNGAQQAFDSWISSPGHKLNIVGDYTHTGLSVKPNNAGDYYFTQMFYK